MTPDRWTLTLLGLAGEPAPALPDLPGRVHRAPPIPETDPYAEAWDELNTPLSAATKGNTP